ncbi:right-handed parallel beta-helix repeat-containing protein [Chryseobacterium sp. YR221]|uniref:right-handed parallel beta-helix repeat-containing protein n=1 Tax=Chryseobacterium sp. YR221 TaxID=1500293 RepID=UPI0009D8849C|nr:right-handed parallel beta-helix repeat-containing protein [Chryseobacterium sp. YR221]SMC47908.1 Right handed beta helix region [Chryseobacterium sp. YR221]
MKIKAQLIFCYILLTSFFSCQEPDFKYKDIPKSMLSAYNNRKTTLKKDNTIYYDLTLALPKNYSRNGNVDYTEIIQKILNEKRNVKFPNFPVLINSKGLFLKSNSKIFFQSQSEIRAKADHSPKTDIENIKDWYDIIRIYNVENVTLYNPKIIGDRKTHIDNKGEWGAGIGIRNSKKVFVYNSDIKDTWGEGIFVGSEDGGYCEDIHIKDAKVDFARRNGIAITSGKNVFLDNILVSNTFGTNPMFGIDIEPSWHKDIIENVNLKNVITSNNFNGGLYVVLFGFSTDDAKYKRNITINIDNYFSDDYQYPFGLLTSKDKKKYEPTGTVNVTNGNWKSLKNGFVDLQNDNKQVKLNIKNISTTDNKDTKGIFNKKNF